MENIHHYNNQCGILTHNIIKGRYQYPRSKIDMYMLLGIIKRWHMQGPKVNGKE
jgi:hypothetical protein